MRGTALLLLVAMIAGCGGEPARSRIVAPTEAAQVSTPVDAPALTKDPRRIATH